MAIARLRTSKYAKKFFSEDWLDDKIVIIPLGIPTQGQLGPHNIPNSYIYEIEVFRLFTSGMIKEVGIHTSQLPDGSVIIMKTSLTDNFTGIVTVTGSFYE